MHSWRGLGRPTFLSAVFAIAGVAGLALAVGFGKADPAVMAGYKTTTNGGGGGGGAGPTTVKITQACTDTCGSDTKQIHIVA